MLDESLGKAVKDDETYRTLLKGALKRFEDNLRIYIATRAEQRDPAPDLTATERFLDLLKRERETLMGLVDSSQTYGVVPRASLTTVENAFNALSDADQLGVLKKREEFDKFAKAFQVMQSVRDKSRSELEAMNESELKAVLKEIEDLSAEGVGAQREERMNIIRDVLQAKEAARNAAEANNQRGAKGKDPLEQDPLELLQAGRTNNGAGSIEDSFRGTDAKKKAPERGKANNKVVGSTSGARPGTRLSDVAGSVMNLKRVEKEQVAKLAERHAPAIDADPEGGAPEMDVSQSVRELRLALMEAFGEVIPRIAERIHATGTYKDQWDFARTTLEKAGGVLGDALLAVPRALSIPFAAANEYKRGDLGFEDALGYGADAIKAGTLLHGLAGNVMSGLGGVGTTAVTDALVDAGMDALAPIPGLGALLNNGRRVVGARWGSPQDLVDYIRDIKEGEQILEMLNQAGRVLRSRA
eukprot:jgi/Mesvir1/2693/Mv22872-RA.1